MTNIMSIFDYKFTLSDKSIANKYVTLKELFQINENQVIFESYLKNKLNEMLIPKLAEEKNILIDKLERDFLKEKEYLFKTVEEQKKLIKMEADSLIRIEKQNIIKDIEFEKEKNASLKERIEELKHQFKLIDSALQEKFEFKLSEERKKHQQEKEKILKDYEELKFSATRKGLDGEAAVKNLLKEIFFNDQIRDTNAALGEADIVQEIYEHGSTKGKIYYEVKNKKVWSKSDYDNFVLKTKNIEFDGFIYVAQALPKNTKNHNTNLKVVVSEGLIYDDINNIYLTTLDYILPISYLLRNTIIIKKQIENNSKKGHEIQENLFKFINSNNFKNYTSIFREINKTLTNKFDEISKRSIEGMSEINRLSNLYLRFELDIKNIID